MIYFFGMEKKKSRKNFRINAKSIFLTYSQADCLSREYIYQHLQELFKSKCLSGIAVAEEKHLDGSNHYHVMLDFSKSIDTINPRLFDILDIHPNVQTARNRKDVLGYILKEDKHVLMDNHIRTLCSKYKATALYLIENYFDIGYGPDLTATELKRFGFDNASKIKTWYKVYQASKVRLIEMSKPGWKPVLERFGNIPTIGNILKFASQCKDEGITRPLKSPQLLLWSSNPSLGKTTFTNQLKANVKTFDFPVDGWWDGYENNYFDLIVWNETNFVGWQISDLNKLFEGYSMNLPIKGSKTFKDDNPLIICTSNLSLEGLLKQKGFDEAKVNFYLPILRSRIVEVEIKDQDLWNYLK